MFSFLSIYNTDYFRLLPIYILNVDYFWKVLSVLLLSQTNIQNLSLSLSLLISLSLSIFFTHTRARSRTHTNSLTVVTISLTFLVYSLLTIYGLRFYSLTACFTYGMRRSSEF